MTSVTSPKSRGFTLMHMLIALPLLAAFLYLGTQLFLTNNMLFKQADRDGERMDRIEMAVHQLREDTWLSLNIEEKTDELILTQLESKIVWRITDDGTLTRLEAGPQASTKHYRGVGAQALIAQPGGVVLGLSSEQYLCPSNRATLQKAKP